MSTTQSAVTGVVHDNGSNVTQTPDNGESLWFLARFCLVAFIDVAGIVGNSLCVVVMTRKSLRSSQFALYTSILAVSDSIIIIQNMLGTCDYVWPDLQLSRKTCGFNNFVAYSAGTFSSWCIVQLTMDRCYAVFRPLEYYDQVHRKRAVIGLVISALLIMGFYSHVIVHNEFKVDTGSCWWLDTFITTMFFTVFLWSSTFLFSLVPFAIVITVNSAIIWRIRFKNSSINGSSGSHTTNNGTIITLMTVSFCFILFTAPACVNSIIGLVTIDELARSTPWENVSVVLFELNFAINFYIYCLTGTKIRREVINLCSCCTYHNTLIAVQNQRLNTYDKGNNNVTTRL